jgi:hypothetical protein
LSPRARARDQRLDIARRRNSRPNGGEYFLIVSGAFLPCLFDISGPSIRLIDGASIAEISRHEPIAA